MKQSPSLTGRLLIFLLLAQALAFVVAWMLFIGMFSAGLVIDTDFTISDLAFFPVSAKLEESVVRGADGTIRLVPSAGLEARLKLNPTLEYAVYSRMDQEPLPGSSPRLAASLHGQTNVVMTDARFVMTDRAGPAMRGSVELHQTPLGRFYFVAAGYEYVWSDIFFALSSDWKFLSTYFVTAFSASAIVLLLGLRGGLAPLRRVADETSRIDMDSLGAGISPEGVPAEIRPVIDAMNAALARVYASAARMRRYTANAAHELRTPLAILRARLQNPDEPTFRADIERDASLLQAIVEQALISARLGEGQALTRESVDLNETVWSVVAAHMPLAIRCRREIEFEPLEGASFVEGNRRAIESVVANLIDNAIRAAPMNSVICVRVTPGPVIEVSDHGDGVEGADRETIFEPFWRKSDEGAGCGLGLAIARDLVEKHGGQLWVEPTPGGGATFKMSLGK